MRFNLDRTYLKMLLCKPCLDGLAGKPMLFLICLILSAFAAAQIVVGAIGFKSDG